MKKIRLKLNKQFILNESMISAGAPLIPMNTDKSGNIKNNIIEKYPMDYYKEQKVLNENYGFKGAPVNLGDDTKPTATFHNHVPQKKESIKEPNGNKITTPNPNQIGPTAFQGGVRTLLKNQNN